MSRIYYRTIRDNQIRLLGKTLYNECLLNGQLDGMRFSFIPYFSEFEISGLTCLWGTEEYSKEVSKAVKMNLDETEFNIYLEPYDTKDKEILAPDGYLHWYFWRKKDI